MSRAMLFCLACVTCDMITTFVIVEILGGVELNPLIRHLIEVGWIKFFIVKYSVGFLLPLVYSLFKKKARLLIISGWLHFGISVLNAISLVVYQLL